MPYCITLFDVLKIYMSRKHFFFDPFGLDSFCQLPHFFRFLRRQASPSPPRQHSDLGGYDRQTTGSGGQSDFSSSRPSYVSRLADEVLGESKYPAMSQEVSELMAISTESNLRNAKSETSFKILRARASAVISSWRTKRG